MANDLLGHLFGIPDYQCAVRSTLRVEIRSGHRRPSAFLADIRHDASIAGKEVRSRFFRCRGDVSEGVHTDLELLRCMTGLSSSLAVKIDQRAKAPRFAADDRNHQRQPEHARANERFWSPANPKPDGQRILEWTAVDTLAGRGRAMPARQVTVLV